LARVRQKDFARAFELVEMSEEVAPAYYEVHRVKGWAHTHSGNIPAAQEAYETAIELEPGSAPLRFWHGGFLLRYGDNTGGASEQLRVAISLDPGAIPIQNELGRCMMYMGVYSDAEQIFRSIITSEIATTKELRIAYDSWCQVSSRQGQTLLEAGEYIPALQCYRDLFRKFDEIPAALKDDHIVSTILRAVPDLRRLATLCARTPEAEEVTNWINLAAALSRPAKCSYDSETPQPIQAYDTLFGYIDRFAAAGTFGFIVADDGTEHFFHRHNLTSGLQITMLRIGDRVSFRLGANDKGTFADRVCLAIRD
jgi:tetratricopeptide (TPR) repeat protein